MPPVIFIFESLKFKVNANDHRPPHVHVESKNGANVRINLETMDYMDEKTEFSLSALSRIMDEVTKRREELIEAWREYHEKD